MADKCKQCNRNISNVRNVKIVCKDCEGCYHAACVNMTEEDAKFLQTNNETWRCGECKKTRRDSLRLESTLEKVDVKNEVIIKLLEEMRTESKLQMKHLEAELGKSVENCHNKIADLLTKIDEQSKTIQAYEGKFEIIIQENINLKTKVKTLESRLEEIEQYSRVNCLEINGVPEKKNENVFDIIKVVGNSLGVEIREEMVDACHRMGSRQDGKSRGIIVKFTHRNVKEDVLHKRKVKRNFNSHDINFTDSPTEVIYVNESLSPARRKILNAARALKREKGFTFVWVKNGRIFLRKNEGDPVIMATSVDQVASL